MSNMYDHFKDFFWFGFELITDKEVIKENLIGRLQVCNIFIIYFYFFIFISIEITYVLIVAFL